MRLWSTHVWGLCISATWCAAAVAACVGSGPGSWLLLALAPTAAALGKRRPRARWLDAREAAPLAFCLLAAAGALARTAGPLALADVVWVVWALWCARLLTARFPSHDGQSLLLSVVLVCAATVASPSPWLAPLLLVYVPSLTSTLITSQLLFDVYMRGFREDDGASTQAALGRRDVLTLRYVSTVALLACSLLLAGAAVFAAFPRAGGGRPPWASAGGGTLPDSVSLTAAPRASGPDAVMVRVLGLAAEDYARGLYLRADVYDAWQGGAFHRSPDGAAAVAAEQAQAAAGGAPQWHYEVRLSSDAFERLPSLGPVARGSLRWAGLEAPLSVRAGSAIDTASLGGLVRPLQAQLSGPPWPRAGDGGAAAGALRRGGPPATALALPAGVDARLLPLARSIVAGAADDLARAARIEAYLRTHATYSLTPSGAALADPLADFLFGGHSGHCEYFATAYALLLRAVGVPARVVGGFAFGAWDERQRSVLFRGSHAHAWIEWWHPARGWLLADATPPLAPETLGAWSSWAERWQSAWDEHVVSFGPDHQSVVVSWVAARVQQATAAWHGLAADWCWPRTSVVAGLVAAALALSVGLLLRVPTGSRFDTRLEGLLSARLEQGLHRPLRPAETLRQGAAALGAGGAAAWPLVHAYEQQRFGQQALAAPARRRLLAAAKALRLPSK